MLFSDLVGKAQRLKYDETSKNTAEAVFFAFLVVRTDPRLAVDIIARCTDCVGWSMRPCTATPSLPQRPLRGLRPGTRRRKPQVPFFASALAARIASGVLALDLPDLALCLSARCADCVCVRRCPEPSAGPLPQRSLRGLRPAVIETWFRPDFFASALAARIASAKMHKR